MNTPSKIAIVQPVYLEAIELLMLGGFIVGGYPLYLGGGADGYSDMDVYAPNSPTWNVLRAYLECYAIRQPRSTHATPYFFQAVNRRFDLVDMGFQDFSWQETLDLADLSPSATALIWNTKTDHRPVELYALYPDDIYGRVCRVLDEHEFTPYRVQSYEKKGYAIVHG